MGLCKPHESKGDQKRDWSLLPPECVALIAERIGRLRDLARLRSVCIAWGWALGWSRKGWPVPPLTYKPEFAPLNNSGVPSILTPNVNGTGGSFCLISHLSDEERFLACRVPEITSRHRIGVSNDGCWIVTLDESLEPAVVNPVTGEEFSLPSLRSLIRFDPGLDFSVSDDKTFSTDGFRLVYFRKIVLSSVPPLGIAAVLYGVGCSYLAFARIGDRKWRPGPDPSDNIILQRDKDVLYHEKDNKFYIITIFGDVVTLDLNSHDWESFQPPKNVSILRSRHAMQLLVSGPMHVVFSTAGDLLQIWKTVHNDERKNHINCWVRNVLVGEPTSLVFVFKFDRSTSTWMRVEDLGDEAIFVGLNNSMAVSTAGKPSLQRNSIYFLEAANAPHHPYCCKCPRDRRVFCVQTNRLLLQMFGHHCKFNWPPPLWCVPSRLRLTCT
ncbi:hypothetical protein HPP92_007930 [Vanilla planifolia]|uniref:KIB1-4 beta-propeller domain-containing protein n=1 Tax=Vanilla planifolia TaxID=51239 RepID=A0A835RS60_VANPL|nr:hypothetical protein HPP92_007930 [Vanilla planifolia]